VWNLMNILIYGKSYPCLNVKLGQKWEIQVDNKILLYRHEIWKYSTGPPPIHHSYKVIIHWARKDFSNFSQAETRIAHGVHVFCSIRMKWGKFCQVVSEKIFRNQPTRNKNCQCQPCILTDRDENCNLYREPSIDASY
jgi:hypothetical protein